MVNRTATPPCWFRKDFPVRAMRAEEDWTWEVRSDDGSLLDHAPVMRGEWLVREGTASATYSDEGFMAVHDAVPGRPGEFTRRSPAILEHEPRGVAGRRFRSTRIRCTRAGKLLCPAGMDRRLQAALLRLDDPDAADHLGSLGHTPAFPGEDILRLEIESRAAADGVASPEWSEGPEGLLVARADPSFVAWLAGVARTLPAPWSFSGLAARHGFHATRLLHAGIEYTVGPGLPGRLWARRAPPPGQAIPFAGCS